MKKIVVVAFIALSLSACAQTKMIAKAQAFYTIPIPGTIPVDLQGKPMMPQRNKVYTVFIETKGGAAQWNAAWVDDKYFSIIPIPVKEQSVTIGTSRVDDRKQTFVANKGNTLTQLELSPVEKYKKPPQAAKPGEMLLEGKWKGKTFYYKIPKVLELASPEYQ